MANHSADESNESLRPRGPELPAADNHRGLLTLWVEGYARSLMDPEGPWRDFARTTVQDWLTVLVAAQPADQRDTPTGNAQRTLVLTVLRGALLDPASPLALSTAPPPPYDSSSSTSPPTRRQQDR